MRAGTINWTVVLFVVAQCGGTVWWAAQHDSALAQFDRELGREREQRAGQHETLKDRDEAIMSRLEAVKDRLEPLASKASRLEALQEGMRRSLDRLENVFDEDRQRGRGQ